MKILTVLIFVCGARRQPQSRIIRILLNFADSGLELFCLAYVMYTNFFSAVSLNTVMSSSYLTLLSLTSSQIRRWTTKHAHLLENLILEDWCLVFLLSGGFFSLWLMLTIHDINAYYTPQTVYMEILVSYVVITRNVCGRYLCALFLLDVRCRLQRQHHANRILNSYRKSCALLGDAMVIMGDLFDYFTVCCFFVVVFMLPLGLLSSCRSSLNYIFVGTSVSILQVGAIVGLGDRIASFMASERVHVRALLPRETPSRLVRVILSDPYALGLRWLGGSVTLNRSSALTSFGTLVSYSLLIYTTSSFRGNESQSFACIPGPQ